jgi:hypothetical protein
MVCAKCHAKLQRLVVPDRVERVAKSPAAQAVAAAPAGAAAAAAGAAGATRPGPKVGVSPLLKRPLGAGAATHKCKQCAAPLKLAGYLYCHGCAYKAGVCAMCGVKVMDTKFYRQTSA